VANFCHSCAVPLDSPEFKGTSDIYCKYCCDENGNLHDRAVVRNGISQWFKSWQPDINDATAAARADLYMRSMPAWAD
jgi:hypothetical protein